LLDLLTRITSHEGQWLAECERVITITSSPLSSLEWASFLQ